MNKAITDGIVIMPLPFAAGLGVWSSGDGTPATSTYADTKTATRIPDDPDFGSALELQKPDPVVRLRYMGETPILPGCYLRVTARVKAISGPLPAVRIAGWPGLSGSGKATGLTETGPATQLTNYGEVITISAIIGTGQRTGVDMVWRSAAYGHFGINLTGPNGGTVRLDDLMIEDVTATFQRDMMSVVDVRDFGAIGDGVTCDSAAFTAADAAAKGRSVLVPAGVFRLGQDVTIHNKITFEGTVSQSANKFIICDKNLHFQTYIDAFGDIALAFRKIYQAFIQSTDHQILDLDGRCISLNGPMDLLPCPPGKTLRNGLFRASPSAHWTPVKRTSEATRDAINPTQLTRVIAITAIPVGALITGKGVPPETYVTARNIPDKTLTLSQPIVATGPQTYTFNRFKYLLEFAGNTDLTCDAMTLHCNSIASGIMLAGQGHGVRLHNCTITDPKDRGLSSIGTGCQGMTIDGCTMTSNAGPTCRPLNANADDITLRDTRIKGFQQPIILTGTNHMITGNRFSHGNLRHAAITLTHPNPTAIIAGNLIDDSYPSVITETPAKTAAG